MFDRSRFDQQQLDKSIAMETSIGKSFMTDPSVSHAAMLIRFYSGSPMSKAAMTVEDKQHLAKLLRFIGGARDLDADQQTLDAHVLATHIKTDRVVNNEVYSPIPNRRQNRFNAVASKQNPIFPWNLHEFDKAVHEVGWAGLPPQMQELITERWREYRLDELIYARVFSLQSLQNVIGLGAMEAQPIVEFLTVDERKTFLYDILDVKWSSCQWLADSTLNLSSSSSTTQSDNPLGQHLRQHHTGFLANVVQASNPDDNNVTSWANDAIRRNKLVISGPSGHSLRYLNHWAECRRLLLYQDELYDDLLPTLEDARIIMMANLMPPKNHHSYHEIMSASIGISDGKQTLAYKFRNSYADLDGGPRAGKTALDHAKYALAQPNSEPLPNPWKAQRPAPQIEAPRTATELAGLLIRFGSSGENVSLVLRSASSKLRLALIPLLGDAVKNGSITRPQCDLVMAQIQQLETLQTCRQQALGSSM